MELWLQVWHVMLVDYTSRPSAAGSSSNTPTLYISLTRGTLRYVFEAHVY